MSFDLREQSLANGQPIRLYEFSRGVLRWAYASCDRDITWDNQVYRWIRGGIGDSGIADAGHTKIGGLASIVACDLRPGAAGCGNSDVDLGSALDLADRAERLRRPAETRQQLRQIQHPGIDIEPLPRIAVDIDLKLRIACVQALYDQRAAALQQRDIGSCLAAQQAVNAIIADA